jgi:hypothetical protein
MLTHVGTLALYRAAGRLVAATTPLLADRPKSELDEWSDALADLFAQIDGLADDQGGFAAKQRRKARLAAQQNAQPDREDKQDATPPAATEAATIAGSPRLRRVKPSPAG